MSTMFNFYTREKIWDEKTGAVFIWHWQWSRWFNLLFCEMIRGSAILSLWRAWLLEQGMFILFWRKTVDLLGICLCVCLQLVWPYSFTPKRASIFSLANHSTNTLSNTPLPVTSKKVWCYFCLLSLGSSIHFLSLLHLFMLLF